MPVVAVLVYIYHPHKWAEIRDLLLQCSNIKLFVAMCRSTYDISVEKDCRKHFKGCKIEVCENKGLDIEPFLRQLSNLKSKEFPYFLKIHTKQSAVEGMGYNWTTNLLNSMIGSIDIFNSNINILMQDDVGAVCDQHFLISQNEKSHKAKIEHVCKLIGISYDLVKLGPFMSGSIFFGKTQTFKNVLTKNHTETVYYLLEPRDLSFRETSSYTHALECILGYLITAQGYTIKGSIVPLKKLYNKQLNKTLHLIITFNNTCYIQENIAMHGIVIESTDEELKIRWAHCDNAIHTYTGNNGVYTRVDEITLYSFNAIEYKEINSDLIHLTDEDAYEHYVIHGKVEGRACSLNQIRSVFDIEFYSLTYNINKDNIIQEYLTKGKQEGRIYSKVIIDNKFDYGYYISFSNHTKQHLFNQYDALKHFKTTNNKCNNILTYKSSPKSLKDLTCVYVANIQTNRDLYFLESDIHLLRKVCKEIIVVSNTLVKHSNNIINIKTSNNHKWYAESLQLGLDSIKTKSYSYLILTNKTTILRDLNSVVLKLQNSDKDFLSLTDSYNEHPYLGLPLYHLQDELIHFKHKNLKLFKDSISECIEVTNNTYTFDDLFKFTISSYIIQHKKTLGSLLTATHELEFLWKDLIKVKLNLMPHILNKYEIPVIKKELLPYFTQLIPATFHKKKKTHRLVSWLQEKKTGKVNNKKICLILHVHSESHIPDFNIALKKVHSICKDITIYVTGKKSVFDKIYNAKYNMSYYPTENRGMDIGPFINLMNYFKRNKIVFDFVIKLQGKTTTSWRNYCFTNLTDCIKQHKDNMRSDVSVSGPYGLLVPLDELNRSTITDFIKRYDIDFDYNNELNSNAFIAGTMFIINHKMFNMFIDKYKVDLNYEYQMLETGKVTNMYATQTHAWERILTCVIPVATQTKLKCI